MKLHILSFSEISKAECKILYLVTLIYICSCRSWILQCYWRRKTAFSANDTTMDKFC